VATLVLPRSLAALFPGAPRRLEAPGATVADVIAAADGTIPGLRNRIVEPGPAIRRHLNVYVDGEQADLRTAVAPGSTVHVIPAVSGGASPAR
jgi:molybdopterin converting factor small subunit